MAPVDPEVKAMLEGAASEAERLVKALTSKVEALRKMAEAKEIAEITAENAEIAKKIEAAKAELRAKQAANGKLSVALPQGDIPAGKPQSAAPAKSKAPVAPTKTASAESKPKAENDAKKEKKAKKAKAPKQPKNTAAAKPVDVTRLNFIVGRITEAKAHPESEKLYIETIDCGEESGPRTILSGLAKHVPLEKMQNRLVVVLANLKPKKIAGIPSNGMVMCANGEDKIEVLDPPAGAEPGDKFEFEGYTGEPDSVLNPKKKIFEAVAPDLKTNDDFVATYKGIQFTIPGKGVCKAQSLANVKVS